jgi:hypothetical protein
VQGLNGNSKTLEFFSTFAVHMHTAKTHAHGKDLLCRARTHGKGSLLCTALLRLSCCRNFVVRGGGEAHGALPCGLEVKRTVKTVARQSFKTHDKELHTATLAQRTAKTIRTAKPLPCDFLSTHGKGAFAGRIVAVYSLPCKAARQSLC